MTLNQQAVKGVSVLSGVTDPDYHRKIGRLLHNGLTEYKRFLRAFLVFPWPVMKVNENL